MSLTLPSTGADRSQPLRRFQAPQPDFLRPVARPGALAWAWCATGVLALAAAGLDSHAAWQDRSHALAQLAMAQTGARAAAARPAQAAVPPAQRTREAEARRWLQQLALPWPAVWAGAELAADGVNWMALSHGPAAGLRLTGTAATLAPVQATAQALRAQQHDGRPVWQDVALASVERMPEGLRFELVARLADTAALAP